MEPLYEALARIGYTHPLHPPLTCIPMGMVIGAFFFALTALFWRRGDLWNTARHCIILALIGVFPTILLGFTDWQYYYGGTWLLSIQIKIVLAMVLTALLIGAVWLQSKSRAGATGAVGLYLLAFLTVVGLGYFGGELVFETWQARETTPRPVQDEQLEPGAEEVTYSNVAGIFSQRCTMCHRGSEPPHGFGMETRDQIMAGSQHGPMVIPGEPQESELVRRLHGISQPRMPLRQPPLPESEISLIERWIEDGAQ